MVSGRFSERIGQVEVRSVLQVESIDLPLRNRLWSLVHFFLESSGEQVEYSSHQDFYQNVYLDFFEEPIDRVPPWTSAANDRMRSYFFDDEWWKPYDLVEFVLRNRPEWLAHDDDYATANLILADYLSGYRFVGGNLVAITDESQLQAIEGALINPLAGVRAHLTKSLGLLSDRDKPDAANSIKEAVSAVESLCSAIVGKRSTLGAALRRLENAGVPLHKALKDSWSSLYGYTSDADGIRHAAQLESGATIDDALFFLVSSSAFIGLLTTKATSAGIELQPVT